MDNWQKLLDGELDELRAHLIDEGEIEMTTQAYTQELFIGDTVRTPGGKIGTVASQCYLDPNDGLETCLVDIRGMNCIAYNTADLEIVTVESVYAELQAVPSYVERPKGYTDEEKAIIDELAEEQSVIQDEYFLCGDIEDPAVQRRLLALNERHVQDDLEAERFLDVMRDSD